MKWTSSFISSQFIAINQVRVLVAIFCRKSLLVLHFFQICIYWDSSWNRNRVWESCKKKRKKRPNGCLYLCVQYLTPLYDCIIWDRKDHCCWHYSLYMCIGIKLGCFSFAKNFVLFTARWQLYQSSPAVLISMVLYFFFIYFVCI